jgi:biopolymer transport protein ExbD
LAGFEETDDRDGPLASINIVPFVDIVLVLLLVFMLTSSIISRASLEVELPRAANAGSRVESTLNLLHTSDGQLLVDGERTASWKDAGERVRRAALRNPKTRAVISADRSVDYGRVVAVIDLVRASGIQTFALDVERGPFDPAAAERGGP